MELQPIVMDLVKLDINDLLGCLNEQPSKIKNEFKTFVEHKVSERRQSSSIIALRDLHNWIKRTFINNIAHLFKGKVNLLDIAVGRGGDIDKWNKAGIANVFGFDVSEESIESMDPFNPGAIQRLSKYNNLKTNVHFEVGNAIQPTIRLLESIDSFLKKNNIPNFQIVSCQFALHYFFESKESLDIAIKVATKYLQKGGIIIFTTTNSDKLRSFFKSRSSKEHSSPLFDISIDKYFKKEPYGNKYTFLIKDTFDQGNYFNTMGPSVEYLVDKEELVKVCGQNGLSPLNLNMIESYKSESKIKYATLPTNEIPFESVVRLWKPKKDSRPITEEERELNDLYTAFLFIKN